MMKRGLLLFVLLWHGVAWGAGMDFVATRPMGYFTEEDTRLFRAALYDALHHPAGTTVSWHNPDTDHRGKIRVVKVFEREGMPCRTLRAFNRAGGVSGKMRFDFCKLPDGQWKVVH